MLYQFVMPKIDEGIPLIVLCCIAAKPGSYLFLVRKVHGLHQVRSIRTSSRSKLHVVNGGGCEFHVVCPVLFNVDVGRKYRCGLCDAGLLVSVSICIHCKDIVSFAAVGLSEEFISLVQRMRECKDAGELACRG